MNIIDQDQLTRWIRSWTTYGTDSSAMHTEYLPLLKLTSQHIYHTLNYLQRQGAESPKSVIQWVIGRHVGEEEKIIEHDEVVIIVHHDVLWSYIRKMVDAVLMVAKHVDLV